jgi:hypothetical protein
MDLFHEVPFQFRDRHRSYVYPLTPGDDCLQQAPLRLRQQHPHDVRWWFFERLQYAVCRLPRHEVGVLHEQHLALPFIWRERGGVLQIFYLLDDYPGVSLSGLLVRLRIICRGADIDRNGMYVSVFALQNAAARAAGSTGGTVALAIEGTCEVDGEGSLAHMFGAEEQIGVVGRSLGYAAGETLNRAFLTKCAPHV